MSDAASTGRELSLMFDISWSEFLLIGIVALIVIGPKELPGVMRTLGQYTRKIRGMAADFQNQFQEAMREAEMADLKKQVDDMADDIKNYDPLKSVREDVASIGADIKTSLSEPAEEKPMELKPEEPKLDSAAAASALPEPATTAPEAPPPVPEPVAVTGEPASTERS